MFSKPQVKADWALADLHQLIPYGKYITKPDQEIGIEFELEGPGVLNVAKEFNKEIPGKAPLWKWHEDLSLSSGGAEFVLAKPLSRSLAKEAVEELYYKLKQEATIQLSRRCSTHVHLNFQHMSVNQMYLFLVLHYVLEEATFRAIANDRFGNNFCVPLVLSDTISEDLLRWLYQAKLKTVPTGAAAGGFGGQVKNKYRALNFNCVLNYGSLENRIMGGCKTPSEFFTWLDVLLESYDFAKNNERLTPDFFLNQFSGKGFQLFVQELFPKTWDFIKDVPNIGDILNRGIFAAQDIAYAVDWSPVITGTKPAKVRKTDPTIKTVSAVPYPTGISIGTISSYSQGEDAHDDF